MKPLSPKTIQKRLAETNALLAVAVDALLERFGRKIDDIRARCPHQWVRRVVHEGGSQCNICGKTRER